MRDRTLCTAAAGWTGPFQRGVVRTYLVHGVLKCLYSCGMEDKSRLQRRCAGEPVPEADFHLTL